MDAIVFAIESGHSTVEWQRVLTMSSAQQPEKFKNNPATNRRRFLKMLGLGMAPLVLPRWVSGAEPAVRIGIFGPSHCAVPVVFAHLAGYFTAQGLQVELTNYPSMSAIAKDLISGHLDFGQLVVPLVFALHTGTGPFLDPTPMVIPQITGTDGAVMMFRQGAEIRTPQDLRGKTITNHSRLAVHYLLNMMFLERHGIDVVKDLDFRVMPLNRVTQEMQQGAIDVSIMPEPINAVMENRAIAKAYMLSRHLWPNHPCCCLAARQHTQIRKPRQFEAVTRAMMRASHAVNNPDTREATISLLQGTSDYNSDRISKPVLLRAFTPGRADFHPFPYQSAAILIMEEMQKYGLLDPHVDPQAMAREVFLSQHARKTMTDLNFSPPTDDFRVEKVLGRQRLFHRS